MRSYRGHSQHVGTLHEALAKAVGFHLDKHINLSRRRKRTVVRLTALLEDWPWRPIHRAADHYWSEFNEILRAIPDPSLFSYPISAKVKQAFDKLARG
jgi:hypothetical protein